MRKLVIFLAAVILPCSLITLAATHSRQAGGTASGKDGPADGVEKTTELWAKNRKLLAVYEQQQLKLRSEVIKRRRLYQDGQISKAEVLEVERLLVSVFTHIHEVRRAMMESEVAIMEATMKDELLRLPVPAVNGFSETNDLLRFNGGVKWSLREASRIEKFFSQNFRRSLPVTAFGQTATHNHLRFDHRDAMDVALHPDSAEGKALINYLRRSGIPFIAFRNPVAGAATGAHIHIGNPSRPMK